MNLKLNATIGLFLTSLFLSSIPSFAQEQTKWEKDCKVSITTLAERRTLKTKNQDHTWQQLETINKYSGVSVDWRNGKIKGYNVFVYFNNPKDSLGFSVDVYKDRLPEENAGRNIEDIFSAENLVFQDSFQMEFTIDNASNTHLTLQCRANLAN